MNRRTIIKNLLVASGGLVALPSWAQNWSVADVTKLPSSFSVTSQEILASVADTIIPAGMLLEHCQLESINFCRSSLQIATKKMLQETCNTQLAGLDASARSTYGNAFSSCDQSQRQTLLTKLAASEDKNEKDFFTLIKSETIRGFNTSSRGDVAIS